MKLQITAIIIGTMLAISNAIPATATVSNGKAKNSAITKVSSHKTKSHVDNSGANKKKFIPPKPSNTNGKVKKSANTKVSSQKTR